MKYVACLYWSSAVRSLSSVPLEKFIFKASGEILSVEPQLQDATAERVLRAS